MQGKEKGDEKRIKRMEKEGGKEGNIEKKGRNILRYVEERRRRRTRNGRKE